ncbi:hypothetical protein BpHYR1_003072 [Brachionus plicatilis]|uniref:Uncharacterized protein n=1 Tax=Brachionus plicatilis TaxID=10195 RepID=A0A3M7SEG8_BRAPC|nr:hypothetical protein BpHYR1_003072 [Brachionus plicatilis]
MCQGEYRNLIDLDSNYFFQNSEEKKMDEFLSFKRVKYVRAENKVLSSTVKPVAELISTTLLRFIVNI